MKLVAIACVHISGKSATEVIQPGKTFDIDAAEGERLISLGAAKEFEATEIEESHGDEGDATDENPPVKALADMTKAELKAVAEQYGLALAANASADKIRTAIEAHIAAQAVTKEIDDEADADDTEDDDI